MLQVPTNSKQGHLTVVDADRKANGAILLENLININGNKFFTSNFYVMQLIMEIPQS